MAGPAKPKAAAKAAGTAGKRGGRPEPGGKADKGRKPPPDEPRAGGGCRRRFFGLVLPIALVWIAAGALFVLDQMDILAIPIGGKRLPKVLSFGRAKGGAGTESAPSTESAVDAETAAKRRLDQEERQAAAAPVSVAAEAPALPGAAAPAPAEPTAPAGVPETAPAAAPTASKGPGRQVAAPTESESALLRQMAGTSPGTPEPVATGEAKQKADREKQLKVGRVGSILAAMKPAAAAKALEKMPEDRQIAVLQTMDSTQVAKILTEVSPDLVGRLTQALMR